MLTQLAVSGFLLCFRAPNRQFVACLLFVACLCTSGCQKSDGIQEYTVLKPEFVTKGSAAIPARVAGGPRLPGRSPFGNAASSAQLTYTTPDGWAAQPAGTVRKASFLVESGGLKADVSIIDLPGDAGSVLANVNRWRGQIGLSDISEAELASLVQPTTISGASGLTCELNGPEKDGRKQSTIASFAQIGGATWFIKIQGDDPVIQAEKQRFQDFVASVRLGDPVQPAPN